MTPQQIKDLVESLNTKGMTNLQAAQKFMALVTKVRRVTTRDQDGISLPVDQADTDNILTVYTPLYTTAIQDIKNAVADLGITIP